MGVLAMVQVALALLKGVLSIVVKSGLPAEIIDAVQAGINNTQLVHDHLVSRNDLESFRVEVPW